MPLDISFRSTDAVLAAVDAVFARAEASDGVRARRREIQHLPSARPRRAGRAVAAGRARPSAAPAPWELPLEQRRPRAPQARLAQAMAAEMPAGSIAASGCKRGTGRSGRRRMVLVRRRGAFIAELVRA